MLVTHGLVDLVELLRVGPGGTANEETEAAAIPFKLLAGVRSERPATDRPAADGCLRIRTEPIMAQQAACWARGICKPRPEYTFRAMHAIYTWDGSY